MPTLYLMRHGVTDLNEKGCLQGQIPTSLNERGREQARKAAVFLQGNGYSFAKVYASPLPRAVETCKIVTGLPREQIHLDERLMEMYFGDYEAAVTKTLSEDIWKFIREPEEFAPPQGVETVFSLYERADSFLADLAKNFPEEASVNEQAIFVVSHELMIHAIACRVMGQKWNDRRDLWLDNCEMLCIPHMAGKHPGPIEKIKTLS